MPSLASLLARDAVVSLDTIEQALQRQVLEGGELDTALLELSSVPENTLSAYRAASFDLPAVSRGELEAIDAPLLARVPPALARQHGVLPIALEGERLVLASAFPLSDEARAELAERHGASIAVRIGTELRIQVALARHYGIELGSRMRLLGERVAQHDPGEMSPVQPLASSAAPAAREGSTRPSRAEPGPSPRVEPGGEPGGELGTEPVRVMRVVTLGGAPPPSIAATELDPYQTRPARPSNMPSSSPARPSTRPVRKLSGAPRGPLTQKQAIQMLARAVDRDNVLDVFFRFARQYFECTVLFALRDERLLGLEASGLPQLAELHTVEVPIASSGSVQGAVHTRAPRVVRLDGEAEDRVLAEAIGRMDAQPCALLPVVVRQRVVSMLYGDRSGEPIALADLSDLMALLPAVSMAFERIIQERKFEAVKAQRAPSGRPSGEAPAPEGVFGRPSTVPPPMTPRGDSAPSEPAAPQPAPAAPQPAPAANADDIVDRPTVRLSVEEIANAAARRSERPPAPGAIVDVSDLNRRRKEQDITRPERPSKLPSAPRVASARAPQEARLAADPPSPRTLSQPPPGTGSYAVRDTASEVVAGQRANHLAQGTSAHAGGEARSASAARGSMRSDPRRERGDSEQRDELVSIPAAIRESLRPPRVEQAATHEALVVDLRTEAERLVDDLCRSGPDEERTQVAALLRLGETALGVLERRFPGPLWFDRHKPRQRTPAGRDLSAIARALHAFEDAAVPHVAALLESKAAEVRLCAVIFSAERVQPALLWPLYARLFDSDGQVRLAAFEVLPLFRNVVGFDELLKSLRQKAVAQGEALQNRIAALEALNVLRDAGSVELLAELCGHESRQLSVPAHRALVAITGQDFGTLPKKWRAWFDKNRQRHRAEWLIEGLMHGEERVRAIAGSELQKLTQVYYGFVAAAPKRERERAQGRYRDWWESEGRSQFGG